MGGGLVVPRGEEEEIVEEAKKVRVGEGSWGNGRDLDEKWKRLEKTTRKKNEKKRTERKKK